MLDLIAIVLVITALLSFINARFLKLVPGIGMMLISLLMSLLFLSVNALGLLPQSFVIELQSLIAGIDFNHLVINGMLGVLLFAAAIHIEIEDLLKQKYIILTIQLCKDLSY